MADHKSQDILFTEVQNALEKLKVGSKWYHYKTPEHKYVIEFVGHLENSEEVCVGYRALYGRGILWIRPVDNFLGEVEWEGKSIKRFEQI